MFNLGKAKLFSKKYFSTVLVGRKPFFRKFSKYNQMPQKQIPPHIFRKNVFALSSLCVACPSSSYPATEQLCLQRASCQTRVGLSLASDNEHSNGSWALSVKWPQ